MLLPSPPPPPPLSLSLSLSLSLFMAAASGGCCSGRPGPPHTGSRLHPSESPSPQRHTAEPIWEQLRVLCCQVLRPPSATWPKVGRAPQCPRTIWAQQQRRRCLKQGREGEKEELEGQQRIRELEAIEQELLSGSEPPFGRRFKPTASHIRASVRRSSTPI